MANDDIELDDIQFSTDVKKEKTYVKGEGITEKVLFDDSFDWGALDDVVEKPKAPEKLAELDLLDIQEEIPDIQPSPTPSVTPHVPTKPKEKRVEKQRWSSRKKIIVFGGSAAACLTVAVLFLVTVLSSGTAEDRNTIPVTHEVTMSVQQPSDLSVTLKPFMIPVNIKGQQKYYMVSTTLMLNRYQNSEAFKRKLGDVRGVVYKVLKDQNPMRFETYNNRRISSAILGSVNSFFGREVVERVSIVKQDVRLGVPS